MARRKKSTINENQELSINEVGLKDDNLGNFFDESHGLMMNAKAYLEQLVFGVPRRASENRIIYVRQGGARVKINFVSYELRKGDLLLIPSNYIVLIEAYSNDVEPWLLDFNYNTSEEKEMVGIETIYLNLTDNEIDVVEHYFSLLYQIDTSPARTNEDLMHLIMSMLYYVHQMNEVRMGRQSWHKVPRAKKLKAEFVNMVVTQDTPQLTISEYAKALNVSENYLSIIIKQETHQTVKKWIEQKTETQIKMLLAEPQGRTLAEISEIVGYSSPPQVVRFFKRRTGITPYEFRKMVMKEMLRLKKK